MVGAGIMAGSTPPSTPRPWVPEVPEVPGTAASGSLDGSGVDPAAISDGNNFAVTRLNGDGSLTVCALYANFGGTFSPPSNTGALAWFELTAADHSIALALTAAGFASVSEGGGGGLITFAQPHAGASGNVAINFTGAPGGTGPVAGLTGSGMASGTNATPAVPGRFGPPSVPGTVATNVVTLQGLDSPGPITCSAAKVDDLVIQLTNGTPLGMAGTLEPRVTVAGQVQQLGGSLLSSYTVVVALVPSVERH